jgi:natural product precursor
MKKIKLTDLSHYELLTDELNKLKGGDDPEKGPLCFGCNCACTCVDPTPSKNTLDSTYSSNRHAGWLSRGLTGDTFNMVDYSL